MNRLKNIGIFDSGAGGISFLNTAGKLLPNENFIYYGDLKNAPYGSKTEEEILKLTMDCGDFLAQKNIKAIVMACNTATSTAVNEMRKKLNIPVVSMEPAIKPALSALKSGKVLCLATNATVAQKRYISLLEKLNAEDKVISVGCPGLVEIVDGDDIKYESVEAVLANVLDKYSAISFDAIVLGCTHYIFLKKEIERYAKEHLGGGCKPFFDGNEGTARQLNKILADNNMLNEQEALGKVEIYSSNGDATILQKYLEI